MAEKTALLCSTRLNLALVCFLGCVIMYGLRSNLSFAIVCMVDNEAVAASSDASTNSTLSNLLPAAPTLQECPKANLFGSSNISSQEPKLPGEFLWSKNTQGSLLSAFFWGYLTSQVLGGYLAARIGPKLVIGVALTLSSVVTLFSPLAARLNVPSFFMLRVLLGFAQGGLVPAMHSMWSGWAPPMERSLLTGISYSGAQIGNVLVMPLSGYLCNYGMDGGWPSIFYVLGGAGLLWCVLWAVFVADTPQKHKNIGEAEKEYIVESLGGAATTTKSTKVPIKAILTSTAVWAIFVGHFAGDWGAYTMATSLPSFMNDVLGLDLTSMGLVSSVPYLAYFAVINVGGFTADKLQHSGLLSTVNTRRLAMLVALVGQAFFLVMIGYCGCGQELLVIGLLIVSVGISGFQYSGFAVNYLDICPAYVGTVMGIGNTLSCFAGVLSPLIMGFLTPTMNSKPIKKKSGFSDVVSALAASKQKKASVLDQTANDWKQFVQTENIQEELKRHNQSKDSMLDRQDFLLKADYALFENEKEVREGSKKEWQNVFLVTGLILVFGAVFFCVFASGHVQPWAMAKQDEEVAKKRTHKNLPEVLSRPLIKNKDSKIDI